MTIGIRFNSVSTFIEQVGRRQVWKWGELDQMICLYTGPSFLAMKFKPKPNTKHPNYSWMFCTDSEITYQAATIAEISVTYTGSLTATGGKTYISDPIIGMSPTQGSRDFVMPWAYQTGFNEPDVNGMQTPILNAGTQTTTVRYVGNNVSIRYQTNKAGSIRFLGKGLGLVSWKELTRVVGPYQTSLTGTDTATAQAFVKSVPPIPPLVAAWLGTQVEQQGQFFNCTENYGPTF